MTRPGTLAPIWAADPTRQPTMTPALWRARGNTDKLLAWLVPLVDTSGVHDLIESPLQARKLKPGRPGLPTRACLIGLIGCAATGKTTSAREIATFLHHTIGDDARANLGVRNVLRGNPRKLGDEETTDDYKHNRAIEARVDRKLRQITGLMNPSPHQQPRRLTKPADINARDTTDEERAQAQALLDRFTMLLLAATFRMAPRHLQDQYQRDLSIDATPLRSNSRIHPRNKGYAPFDADAGIYSRKRKPRPDGNEQMLRSGKPPIYALDHHRVIAADGTPGDRRYFPSLTVALALDTPGFRPGEHSPRLLDALGQEGVTLRWLAGDLLYRGLKDDFHATVQRLGGGLLTAYKTKEHGSQGSHQGAVLLEGDFYCPAAADHAEIRDATTLLRQKKITRERYQEIIRERARYRLRHKTRHDDGHQHRTCPAAGNNALVRCPNKPKSMAQRPTRQPDGTRADTRLLLHPQFDKDNGDYPVCDNETITIRPHVLRNKRQPQDLQFGTTEHRTALRALRNTQEGGHHDVKNAAREGLGNPQRRTRRGIAAQTVITAVHEAVGNLRRIASFLENATTDTLGRLSLPRHQRKPDNHEAPLGEIGYQDDDDTDLTDYLDPPDDDTPPTAPTSR